MSDADIEIVHKLTDNSIDDITDNVQKNDKTEFNTDISHVSDLSLRIDRTF